MPAEILPDYLKPGLRAVFVGTAVGTTSAARRHYYAHPSMEFWPLLYSSGLTANRFFPDDDSRILDYGFGLTDLVKTKAASSDRGLTGWDVPPGFVAKMERHQPAWIVFHGKKAAEEVSKFLRHGSHVLLGTQEWPSPASPSSSYRARAAQTAIPAGLRACRRDWPGGRNWRRSYHRSRPISDPLPFHVSENTHDHPVVNTRVWCYCLPSAGLRRVLDG